MQDGSSQKRLALAFDSAKLQKEDGAQQLVAHLREKLGNQAPIDLMKARVTYMYQMQRKRGEIM
eukprot:13552666-Alexandrium_andersonii.AAC.1